MTNIFNMFLAQRWNLKTSSMRFHDLKEIKQYLSIFSSWYLLFWLFLNHSLKEIKHWKLDITNYWVIREILSQSSKAALHKKWNFPLRKKLKISVMENFIFVQRFSKYFWKIYQLAKFGSLMGCGLKDIFTNAPCLMY